MSTPIFRLDNDVAIVTGAGSRLAGEIGNGRAISIILARQGAKVALLDYNIEWAAETKKIIEDEGGIAEVIQCDVSSEESCKNAVEKTVELWGALHILINNGSSSRPLVHISYSYFLHLSSIVEYISFSLDSKVGVHGPPGTVVDVDLAAWDRDMRINLTSMVLMSRFAIPHMRSAGRGAIVNLSSVSGIRGGHPGILYPTSKGAVIQFTRAMAAHHGKENIRSVSTL